MDRKDRFDTEIFIKTKPEDLYRNIPEYMKIEEKYGPHRIRRMCKEEMDKMSLLFGVERKERDEFNKLMTEEIIKRYK